jgi:hypothetical protein
VACPAHVSTTCARRSLGGRGLSSTDRHHQGAEAVNGTCVYSRLHLDGVCQHLEGEGCVGRQRSAVLLLTTVDAEEGLLPVTGAEWVGFDGGDGIERIVTFVGVDEPPQRMTQVILTTDDRCWRSVPWRD